MERPQARIINQQHVESEREVTGWEAEEILRKYSGDQYFSNRPNEEINTDIDNNLSFEEMVRREEEKRLYYK